MTPERWQRVRELFRSALGREKEARAAFLERACAGDKSLRREVESLLASHDEADIIIEGPLRAKAAGLFGDEGPAAGQRLGHFEVITLLGEGGMGAVYLARDTKLGRKVALKLLPPYLSGDADRLRRFEQEACAASSLNHPNILTVYEIGEASGRRFIATEYIEGKTLRERMTGAPMKVGEALDVAAQVASALSAAHAAGIIHRDVKPENIMVRRDALVKVLDFGLAKLTKQEAAGADATTHALVKTGSGVLLGTAPYMSPEQARGEPLDTRSDVFSLGLVLYEMVAGGRAFQGASPLETVAAILHQEPKPLPARVPATLANVILRCLRKDPARRYQSMADLKAALEDLREEFRAGRRVPAPLRRPAAVWPALLLAAALSVLFVWQPWRKPRDAEPLQAAALTTLPGVELYPSLSPGGDHVVFTWTGPRQDNLDIYVQMIGQGSPLRLTSDPRSDWNPVWSPDGRWIAFLRGEPLGPLSQSTHELRLVPPLGGTERLLAKVRVREFSVRPVYLAWSADGSALVVTDSPGDGRPDALFAVSVETGERRQLTNPQPPVIADTSPAVSPDGDSLAFRRSDRWDSGALYLLPLGEGLTPGGEPRRLTPVEQSADYPAWVPGGREILFSAGGGLWKVAVSGEERPRRLPFIGQDGLMPATSRPRPDRPARLAYVRSFGDTNIWRVQLSDPAAPSPPLPAVAISSTRQDIHPRFSPDGRRVAFTSDRSGSWEIWLADSDGSNAFQLTSMGARTTGAPHWSPDGQFITFASNLEGEFEIYSISASGGRPRNLTSHPAFDHAPTFSTDGQWIYFCSTRGGKYDIWKIPASGGDAIRVTPGGGFSSAESADGAYLYYTQTADTPTALWRMPAAGGQPVKVLDGVVWWNFFVVGNGIYYIDQPAGEARLQFYDISTRESTTVAPNLGDVECCIHAAPDGRTILFTRTDSRIDDLMLVEDFR